MITSGVPASAEPLTKSAKLAAMSSNFLGVVPSIEPSSILYDLFFSYGKKKQLLKTQ